MTRQVIRISDARALPNKMLQKQFRNWAWHFSYIVKEKLSQDPFMLRESRIEHVSQTKSNPSQFPSATFVPSLPGKDENRLSADELRVKETVGCARDMWLYSSVTRASWVRWWSLASLRAPRCRHSGYFSHVLRSWKELFCIPSHWNSCPEHFGNCTSLIFVLL